jgi:hypothetical protein
MPRSEPSSWAEQPKTAAELRRRAERVRYLMWQMTSQADHDRLREYAEELEAQADELGRASGLP